LEKAASPIRLKIPLPELMVAPPFAGVQNSETFSVAGHRFHVGIRTDWNEGKGEFGFYLHFEGPSEGLRVKFQLKLIDNEGGSTSRSLRAFLSRARRGLGWKEFVSWPNPDYTFHDADGKSYLNLELKLNVQSYGDEGGESCDLDDEPEWPDAPF